MAGCDRDALKASGRCAIATPRLATKSATVRTAGIRTETAYRDPPPLVEVCPNRRGRGGVRPLSFASARAWRWFTAPVIAAVALWCTRGLLDIVTGPAGAVIRVAMLPPWWLL